MKHVFRFLFYITIWGGTCLLVAPALALFSFVVYPLWNLKWYRPTGADLSWRDVLYVFPLETWKRAIGTYVDPFPESEFLYTDTMKSKDK